MGTSAMPNSDHPLLEQIGKLRAEAKVLDKQKRKAAKQFATEKQQLEARIETLVTPVVMLASDSVLLIGPC
jgi:hypothetical protein